MIIVSRDIREDFANAIVDRKVVFVQNIEIFDVANDVTNEINVDKTNDFIEIINDEKSDEVVDAIDVKNEKNEKVNSTVVKDEKDEKNEKNEKDEKNNAKNFDFFACFVRTCSCNLMLFSNLFLQRLHV